MEEKTTRDQSTQTDFSYLSDEREHNEGPSKRVRTESPTKQFVWPEQMKPSVRQKFEVLVDAGKCRMEEFDTRILDSLAELPEDMGSQIMIKFSEADMNSMRNKSGFLAGVIKRFRVEYCPSTQPSFPTGYPSATYQLSLQSRIDSLISSGKVRRDELDQRCLEMLGSLPDMLAHEVLNKFMEADLATINSKSGFLLGIIRRYREQALVLDPTVAATAYAGLPFAVQAKLEALFATRLVERQELDAKCFLELRQLPEPLAMEVVDKLCEANMSEIRNKTAFFLGILKRYRSDPRFAAFTAAPPNAAAAAAAAAMFGLGGMGMAGLGMGMGGMGGMNMGSMGMGGMVGMGGMGGAGGGVGGLAGLGGGGQYGIDLSSAQGGHYGPVGAAGNYGGGGANVSGGSGQSWDAQGFRR